MNYSSILQITDVFVGSSRSGLLDRVSPSHAFSPVLVQFGKFLKIIVVLGSEV